MLESLFNKPAGLQACNVIKKRLHHTCFPVTFAKFLRTPFLKNDFRGLRTTICEQMHLIVIKTTTIFFKMK